MGDDHISALLTYVIHRWCLARAEVIKGVHPYWSFRNEVAVNEGITMKGRRIILPASVHKRALGQLHVNHMGIGKRRLLTFEAIYWININTEIKKAIKISPISFNYMVTQTKGKILSH